MTDFELTKLAAKAIGVNIAQGSRIAIDGRLWDPLADDGDALRLAIKLRMVVYVDPGYSEVMHGNEWFPETHNDDPAAATRRAIVRAAAEIERSLS